LKNRTLGLLAMAGLCACASALAAEPAKVDGSSAFEQLKKLEGDWDGHAMTPDGPRVTVTYHVTSGANTVEEKLFAGTPHEMISMYFLDGKELVLDHYCASGNQPHLRLNPATSNAQELNFEFVSGTNLNPAVDSHMHTGKILIKDADHIESLWTGYENGKPVAEPHRIILMRRKL
jgi:hypothetical protein